MKILDVLCLNKVLNVGEIEALIGTRTGEDAITFKTCNYEHGRKEDSRQYMLILDKSDIGMLILEIQEIYNRMR